MSKYYKLDVKAENLGDEARSIRRRELKCRKWKVTRRPLTTEEKAKFSTDKWARIAKERRENREYNATRRESLYRHRIDVVRPEARATHLALGYLKGTPYKSIERTCHVDPNFSRVWKLVCRYGNVENNEDNRFMFKNWVGNHNRVWIS